MISKNIYSVSGFLNFFFRSHIKKKIHWKAYILKLPQNTDFIWLTSMYIYYTVQYLYLNLLKLLVSVNK